jgi:hypothetical protein
MFEAFFQCLISDLQYDIKRYVLLILLLKFPLYSFGLAVVAYCVSMGYVRDLGTSHPITVEPSSSKQAGASLVYTSPAVVRWQPEEQILAISNRMRKMIKSREYRKLYDEHVKHIRGGSVLVDGRRFYIDWDMVEDIPSLSV